MPWCDERNTFADECRNHVDDKLIDLTFIEERRDYSGASHHPDVFSLSCTQAFREFPDRFVHKLDPRRRFGFVESARENIILQSSIESRLGYALFLKSQSHIAGLASQQDRVDRLVELAHPVVAFDARAVEPINRPILARDEAVSAGGDVNDDLSHKGVQKCRFSRFYWVLALRLAPLREFNYYRTVMVNLYLDVPFISVGRETVIE